MVLSSAKWPLSWLNPNLFSSAFIMMVDREDTRANKSASFYWLDYNLSASKPLFVFSLNTPLRLFTYKLYYRTFFSSKRTVDCVAATFMSALHENQHGETWRLFEWGDLSQWTNITSAFVVTVNVVADFLSYIDLCLRLAAWSPCKLILTWWWNEWKQIERDSLKSLKT